MACHRALLLSRKNRMTNRKLILLSALCTLFLFTIIAGCSKSASVEDDRNKICFWNNEAIVDDTITVTLIHGPYTSDSRIAAQKKMADCNDDAGVASFTTKTTSYGYSYTAISNHGWEWGGTVDGRDKCTTIELRSKDAIAVGEYNVTFWSNAPGNGIIKITMDNGIKATITTVQQATGCGGSGNVRMHAGLHHFTAEAANGKTWSDTVWADQPCRLYELK